MPVAEREAIWAREYAVPSKNTCLANTQESDRDYEPCGKELKKHQDGEWYCPRHGWMH
jgi:hypothetical protein